jgi:hypothetical protein
VKDKLFWTPSKRGLFEVKSFYYALITHDRALFPRRSIWRSEIPLKVAFFICSTALGKILTLDNLRKSNLIVVDWCCMCKKSRKTIDHLLLHCKVAKALWNIFLGLCGLG